MMKFFWFSVTWGLPFVAYLFLQAVALLRLRKRWRLAALLPLLPMFVIVVLTIQAYRAESNLWPILLIFASPMAAIYVGVILLLDRQRKQPPEIAAATKASER